MIIRMNESVWIRRWILTNRVKSLAPPSEMILGWSSVALDQRGPGVGAPELTFMVRLP